MVKNIYIQKSKELLHYHLVYIFILFLLFIYRKQALSSYVIRTAANVSGWPEYVYIFSLNIFII